MKWTTVREFTTRDNVEGNYRVRASGKSLIIEKEEDDWKDVTSECYPKMTTSCRAVDEGDNSMYTTLCHEGKTVVLFKPDGAPILDSRMAHQYKIKKGRHATFSFCVLRMM